MRMRREDETDGIEEQIPDELLPRWRAIKRIMLRIQQRQLMIDLERIEAAEMLAAERAKAAVAR